MTPAEPEGHERAVRDWWAARDERLRSPDGWLTLVGLHWLEEGENRFGSDPANQIVLRGDDVPALAGSLWLADGAVHLNGQQLRDDTSGEPTVLDLGTLRMYVIRRGQRFALRVRDRASPALGAFQGMRHFPLDHEWRVPARLEPARAGKELEIVDVTGAVSREPTPGSVAFERRGATWHLDALPGDEEGTLWLLFGDETNGAETYGGGRMLYTEAVQADGSVVVDFNLAYNPPCVFSPYATCPLPPPQNWLAMRIEAGELDYEASH
jgi:uncharacterized protein (DUF1684 family)